MVDEPTIFEESKVSESKDYGLLFFLLWDFDILEQMHCKEEGKNGELQDCTCSSVNRCLAILAMTQAGMAFCCFPFGLAFL